VIAAAIWLNRTTDGSTLARPLRRVALVGVEASEDNVTGFARFALVGLEPGEETVGWGVLAFGRYADRGAPPEDPALLGPRAVIPPHAARSKPTPMVAIAPPRIGPRVTDGVCTFTTDVRPQLQQPMAGAAKLINGTCLVEAHPHPPGRLGDAFVRLCRRDGAPISAAMALFRKDYRAQLSKVGKPFQDFALVFDHASKTLPEFAIFTTYPSCSLTARPIASDTGWLFALATILRASGRAKMVGGSRGRYYDASRAWQDATYTVYGEE